MLASYIYACHTAFMCYPRNNPILSARGYRLVELNYAINHSREISPTSQVLINYIKPDYSLFFPTE